MKVGKDEGCSVAMQMTSTGGKEVKVRKRSENVRRGLTPKQESTAFGHFLRILRLCARIQSS